MPLAGPITKRCNRLSASSRDSGGPSSAARISGSWSISTAFLLCVGFRTILLKSSVCKGPMTRKDPALGSLASQSWLSGFPGFPGMYDPVASAAARAI